MEIVKLAKKICFIVTDAISFNVLFRGQLEYIREHSDFDVTLICGGNDEQLKKLYERKVGKVINIDLKRKPTPIKDVKALISLIKYLLNNQFDILVYSTPKALLLSSIATFISRQNNTVALVHGRAYENFEGVKKRVFQAFDKLSFRISHKALFVSQSLLQKYIDENLIDIANAKIIGEGSANGVDIDVFKPVNSEYKSVLKKSLGIASDCFLVCIVGRICRDKGIEDIGKVAEYITDKKVKFLFVGDFEDEYGRQVVNKIVKREQGYHISYTSNIHEIFQCSNLHLFLSHREGFGNVSIEAASCGIPTFAYDVVGVKDSVNDGVSGQIFNFQDTVSIVDTIIEASRDKDFEQKYPKARNWAIENYDQKNVWENYLQFYLENI